MTVSFTSSFVRHERKERRSRHLRGLERKQIAEKLKIHSPSTVYNLSFCSLTQSELEPGKRDKTGGSPDVIRKISSQESQKQYPDIDLVKSLSILREQFLQSGSSDFTIPGYIQRITAYPLSIILFTELGVRMYHYLAKSSTIFCDATGTVVSLKKFKSNDTLLYYMLWF